MRCHVDSAARRLVFVAALICVGATLGAVETFMLPPMTLPGLRLGLGNLAVVLALACATRTEALYVALGKVFLTGLATGHLFGPVGALSVAGSLCAWLAMVVVASWRETTPVGWSVAGAFAHVTAQFLVAVVISRSPALLVALPLSVAVASISGLAIGLLVRALVARLSRAGIGFVSGGGGSRDTAASGSVRRGSSAVVVVGSARGGQ